MDTPSTLRTTRSGFTFLVRPAHAGDEPLLADFFTHVTMDDLRFRYLTALSHVTREQIRAMTLVDHQQTDSFLAFTRDGSVLVAAAVLACDPAMKRAEVAIMVHADYKDRGIGWDLLHHMAQVASARGVQIIESLESRDNRAAIEVEENSGFTAHAVPGDWSIVRVSKVLAAN